MSKNLKIFFASFFASLSFWWLINVFQKSLENYLLAQITQPLENIQFIEIPQRPRKPELELEAKSALSVRVALNSPEKILFEKEVEKPLPIASLTKLMTALIIFEDENYNREASVTISAKAANQGDAPVFGNLRPGEYLPVKKLLELMLVYSSNDAAWALSEVIGTENFVQKMNQKAEILGLSNTHFINPTGLDPRGLNFNEENLNYFNHSTTKDLVKLAQYILKEHPEIFEISRQTPLYRLENGILDLFLTQKIIGGKTGYTKETGGCLLFVFSDGKTPETIFINIILAASSPSARVQEIQKLINWLNK